MSLMLGNTKIASKNVTGDTLPINSVIRYDGTTVPDNWELYEEGPLLITKYNVGSNVTSFTISDLDIVRDGDVYEITGNLVGTTVFDVGMKINGTLGTTVRHETTVTHSSGTSATMSYWLGTSESFGCYMGKTDTTSLSTFKGTIYRRSSNLIYVDIESEIFLSGTHIRFKDTHVITTSTTNITSLVFAPLSSGTFTSGTEVRVYRK